MQSGERFKLVILMVAGCVAAVRPCWAGIKLITLPARERVEIQLDNPDVTLVEEERIVPLAKGDNDVVFAWANANIDKDSIQITTRSSLRTLPCLDWKAEQPRQKRALLGRIELTSR